MVPKNAELRACTPVSLDPAGFNANAALPYGLTTDHVRRAMEHLLAFLGFVNKQLNRRGNPRLESMLMQANFSSMVGEFIKATIPKYCQGLVPNRYHNGHPDLIPCGRYEDDRCQPGEEGIEVKGSRNLKSWQGHNAENTYLMVFSFDSNRPVDPGEGIGPKPFRFLQVAAGRLTQDDWTFAGRREGSRRTITATVNPDACERMIANAVYVDPILLNAARRGRGPTRRL